MNTSRREFIKRTTVAGAGLALLRVGTSSARAANNSDKLTKWLVSNPLRGLGPAGIPVMSSVPDPVFPNTDLYRITVGEFTDVLHPQLPGGTTLWGYWDTTAPVKHHLGGVIIATRGTASRIRFTNALPNGHIIPVDPTVMVPGTAFSPLQNRTATHLHGGWVPWISDGGPFDWFAPTGASGLSFLNGPGSDIFDTIPGLPMGAGQADYFYPNDQTTRLLWYHDHAYGITRLNAYAGVATGYLLLDPAYDAAKIIPGKVPGLGSTLPLIFQDKKFVSATTGVTDPTWAAVMTAQGRGDLTAVGSLWYEHIYDPKEFRLLKSMKNLPAPNPSAIPEFFGDTMLANGTVYPLATVEAKRYRFLILNACNARFLNINLLQVAPGAEVATNPKTLFANLATNPAGPSMIQIGNEAGYLDSEVIFPNNLPFNPATLTGNLLLAPAERADVIIDFTGRAGQEFVMYNDAPGPFPAGPPTTDYFLGNPKNPIQPLPGTGPDTRQILRIKVVAASAPDPQPSGPILVRNVWDPVQPSLVTIPAVLPVPTQPLAPAVAVDVTRDLTLNEDFDPYGRLRQLLGTTLPALVGKGFGLDYLAPTTETPAAGAVEVWRIFNLTADTHPIHFHLVNVQVLSRQPFRIVSGVFTPTGVARGPEMNEIGWKETVQMHPGEVTSVIMKFDLPPVPFNVPPSPRTGPAGENVGESEFVWHCHILEHEEHDMMRPLAVRGPNPQSTLVVTPLEATVAAGGTVDFTIIPGTPTYNVTSSDPDFSVAATAPNAFSVTAAAGLGVGTGATITITDAAGLVANVTVTIV